LKGISFLSFGAGVAPFGYKSSGMTEGMSLKVIA
jgi:hypothetical protein